ncbi:uncharacterized protein LOC134278885 [Saccostrea cucullata]|uniref:uncharacterized protein LOC134278885 n=1 Tax=Saccostrea cuccullata TaxID=36930 RepID=UPI002ED36E11
MVYGAIVGMICSEILGAVWYHPRVFGNAWMKTAYPGKTEPEIQATVGANRAMYLVVLTNGLLCFLINFALGPLLRSGSCLDAVVRGILISMVIILIDISHCLFSARSLAGFVIDRAYDTCMIILICVCIATIG